ncbi:ribonuclease protein [Salix suchowensis]|nr:ribonuclease protein [Salix suchowensis]
MVANNDRLNWDSFTYLLPVQVIMVSAVSPPPSTDMKEDSMIKRHSPDGNFTVSSAYDVLRDMDGDKSWPGTWEVENWLYEVVDGDREVKIQREAHSAADSLAGFGLSMIRIIGSSPHLLRDVA